MLINRNLPPNVQQKYCPFFITFYFQKNEKKKRKDRKNDGRVD